MTQVQVGDFGLACCFQHSPENVTLISQKNISPDHKGEIGTRLYAAPEQLKGKCDPKSDIYSLGIVLFELLQPFSTSMERSKLITQLKTGNIAPDLMTRAPKL
ncbi:unnamed protein product, partial [Timema podura]|nr:unnamed protein product [Timema podura]